MELQCDVCSVKFDLVHHRPKNLPCGHSICEECVENPGLQKKCPSCKKSMGRNTNNLPDNLLAIRMIELDAASPRKKPKTEDTPAQQLQRGVDAARKVVQLLRQVVPMAMEALNRQLDTSVEMLRQMEEALKQQVQREAAGDVGAPPSLSEQLQLAEHMEHSLRLLQTKCSVLAEGNGSAWRASVQLDVVRVFLLQLETEGQLKKVEDVAAAVSSAAYVGPPMTSTLYILDDDLDGGRLKLNDILRDRSRWRNARSIMGLKGEGHDQLLRVLAPQLEELQILDATPSVMEEVLKMSSLRRLDVHCNRDLNDYPALPLRLRELRIVLPSETQLRCLERMPRLRSLSVWNYLGPHVSFSASLHGALRWLRVCFNIDYKTTMISLIRSYASSLQELVVLCSVSDDGDGQHCYFPELGQDLAASGLQVLRRLILQRPVESPCTNQLAACVLQRQSLRGFFHLSFEVLCKTCNASEV